MWNRLKPRVELGADLVKERDLLENQESFNAVIVFLTWYRLVFDRFDALVGGISVIERDSLEKKLNLRASQFLDRWVFGSQWANVWGEGVVLNFQNFATDLSNFGLKLKKCAASILIDTVDDGISQLMGRISIRAGEHVSNAVVRDRRRVRAYYPLLWVWHRLDQTRWTHSSIPMRTGRRRVTNLEVDHTVADAWWGRLVNQAIDAKLAGFAGTDEERSLVAPDNFESKLDALIHKLTGQLLSP